MRFKPIYFLLVLISLTNCSTEKCNCLFDKEVLKENNVTYEKIKESKSWDVLGLQDYVQFKNDTYRLTIYPSWSNSKISEFRMENNLGNLKILVNHYNRIEQTGEKTLKKIGQTQEIKLTEEDWTNFENLIAEKCFWTMKVRSKETYLDGTGWILESKKREANICSNQKYHIVTRVADSPEYFELCDKFLKLANSSKK